MITRVAASFLLVAIAAVLVSPEVIARGGGGFVGGRAGSPAIAHARPTIPSVVRPGGALAGTRGVLRGQAFRRDFFFGHRNRFGNRWSGRQWYGSSYGPYDSYGSYGYGGDYYGPTNDVPPYEPPPAYSPPGYPVGGGAPDLSPKVIYVMPYRPGCDSETQKVPGRNGGEHSVRIVRC